MSQTTCTSCGAPIHYSTDRIFAVCDYCGTHIDVRPVLAEVVVTREDELQQLEQWWLRESEPYVTRDRAGNRWPPEKEKMIHTVAMTIGGVLALASLMISGSFGNTPLSLTVGMIGFFVFPTVFSLPAALLHERCKKRYESYKRLEAEHQRRRLALEERHAARG
jgi:hypothetical protein